MIKPPAAPSMKEKLALVLFGLVLGVILLELGLRLGGWVFVSLQEHRNKAASKDTGAYRILCLGESTTARSTELDEGESSYPSQLQEILNLRDQTKKFVVINAGVPGITTTKIVKQLSDNLNKYRPAMVITMIGINDGGNILPYASTSLPRILSFFGEYRVYKLASLLWQHSVNKLHALQTEGFFSTRGLRSIKPRDAEARLRRALQINSRDSNACLALGSYYLNSARFQDAEALFKKAIMDDPRNDAGYLGLGVCYLETARFKEAEAHFRKAIAINPRNYEAHRELSLYYLHEGRLQELEETLKESIARAPENGKVYFLLGVYYMSLRKDREAEDILKKAVELKPENLPALLALGAHYANTARFPKAEQTFDRFDDIKPVSYETYVELGYCYLQTGRYRKGEELLLEAIAMDPHNYEPYRYLGYDCYCPTDRYREAEGILRSAIVRNPESMEAYSALGQLYINEGKYPQAQAMLNRARKAAPSGRPACIAVDPLEERPRSQIACATFAGYYLRATRFREAETLLREILEINPRNYAACLQLGNCYRAAGRLREAHEMFVRAIAINPGESRAYFRLGSLYKIEAKYQDAERVLRKGLEVNPGNYYICSLLAQLYVENKKLRDAEALFQKIAEINPRDEALYLRPGGYPEFTAQPEQAHGASEGELRLDIKKFIERSERLATYPQATIDNYRKLREIVFQRGIKLAVVQYPCRSILPLMDIFEDKEDIIFVDNESIFKEAIQKGNYNEYFNDHFAGDFGHCTLKGNRLLAQNIADAVIQACNEAR